MAQEATTGHWKGQYPWPFGRDPNSSVLRRDVESDRLIGNVSVTYVTSPWLLYHRWAAGPRLGSSAKTWICAAPAAYLCSRCDQRQLDAIIACQCALARLVYTRSGLVSLSDIPFRRSSDVTSPFPPSGNETLRRKMLRECLQRYHALNHLCNQSEPWARRHGRVMSWLGGLTF